MRRGARDQRQGVDAVEVEQGGRPDSFDGNHSNNLVSWFVVNNSKRIEDIHEGDLNQLMHWTAMGHLAWVVVPVSLPE